MPVPWVPVEVAPAIVWRSMSPRFDSASPRLASSSFSRQSGMPASTVAVIASRSIATTPVERTDPHHPAGRARDVRERVARRDDLHRLPGAAPRSPPTRPPRAGCAARRPRPVTPAGSDPSCASGRAPPDHRYLTRGKTSPTDVTRSRNTRPSRWSSSCRIARASNASASMTRSVPSGVMPLHDDLGRARDVAGQVRDAHATLAPGLRRAGHEQPAGRRARTHHDTRLPSCARRRPRRTRAGSTRSGWPRARRTRARRASCRAGRRPASRAASSITPTGCGDLLQDGMREAEDGTDGQATPPVRGRRRRRPGSTPRPRRRRRASRPEPAGPRAPRSAGRTTSSTIA